jgi:hypothetical protein
MGLMEGRNLGQIGDKYKDMFVPAITANWQVWPLAQVRPSLFSVGSVPDEASPVDQLPIHALALPRPFPVYVWYLLDALPLRTKR